MSAHCITCACDPTSPEAIARANQILPFKVDRWSYLYCLMTPPSAHKEVVEYFQRHRPIGTRAAAGPSRILQFPASSLVVEHQLAPGDYMPVVIHKPGPAPSVHRRRGRR